MNSGNAALDALIATAQREEPAPVPQPASAPQQEAAVARPAGRTRVRGRGGVPVRRPRPQQGGQQEQQERRRPNGPREEPVATLERYSHKVQQFLIDFIIYYYH